jgi:hypothetical protein
VTGESACVQAELDRQRGFILKWRLQPERAQQVDSGVGVRFSSQIVPIQPERRRTVLCL